MGLGNLERFGESLDGWFEQEDTPIWITEYGHETLPLDPLGVDPELQARYAEEALAAASASTRVRTFLWFILRDTPGTSWQSGLLSEDGSPKPSLATFTASALELDARNPIIPEDADSARVPALELAYSTPAGDPIEVAIDGAEPVSVPLGTDGWIEVPLANAASRALAIEATNSHGQAVLRTVERRDGSVQLE